MQIKEIRQEFFPVCSMVSSCEHINKCTAVFWNVMLCCLKEIYQHFRTDYCSHVLGRRWRQHVLQNACKFTPNVVAYLRRPHSSKTLYTCVSYSITFVLILVLHRQWLTIYSNEVLKICHSNTCLILWFPIDTVSPVMYKQC